jgi:hypothetical protein
VNSLLQLTSALGVKGMINDRTILENHHTVSYRAAVVGWERSLAAEGGVCVRLHTRSRVSYAHPRCCERTTCVPDPGRCARPVGRHASNSVPCCGSGSRGVRGSPADRTTEVKNGSELRDHALAQVLGSQRSAAQTSAAGGALSPPRRAGFSRARLCGIRPAAGLRASGAARAGIPGADSSAGGDSEAGICACILCAGRSAGEGDALWPAGGVFA